MHVGVRSTWLNSVALSRDKDIFFEKKKIRLFVRVYSRINVVISKGEFLKILEKSFFEKKSWKIIFEKKSFLKKIILFFERKILRVESGRAYTHVHRRGKGAVSGR
jgi:hypothetical protein